MEELNKNIEALELAIQRLSFMIQQIQTETGRLGNGTNEGNIIRLSRK